MPKPTLRPLRLVNLKTDLLDNSTSEEQNGHVDDNTISRGIIEPLLDQTLQVLPKDAEVVKVELPRGEEEARLLLKRTPGSYLLNQAYGLWVFGSLFLLTVIVTRKLSVSEYGVYAVAMAAFNTIAYIVALGLEDATTTFIPRVFAEHGKAAAAFLVRRLLLLRLLILALSVGIMLFAMPALAAFFAIIPLSISAEIGR